MVDWTWKTKVLTDTQRSRAVRWVRNSASTVKHTALFTAHQQSS